MMKKLISILMFFVCVVFSTEKVNAAPEKYIVFSGSGIGSNNANGYIYMYNDFSIEFNTVDKIATSSYRYRTLGLTLTRCKYLAPPSAGDEPIHRYVYDENGEEQRIEFSLDSANVQVETQRENGWEYNKWTIPGSSIMWMIEQNYPEWRDALVEVVTSTNAFYDYGTPVAKYDTEALVLDSLMTVLHYDKETGVESIKGSLDDLGNGRVITSGLVYTNTQDRRCKKCSHEDALFEHTLMDGYSLIDTKNMLSNSHKNERICWYCEGPFVIVR